MGCYFCVLLCRVMYEKTINIFEISLALDGLASWHTNCNRYARGLCTSGNIFRRVDEA